MNIKFFISDISVCGHLRGEVPARAINRNVQNMHVDVKGDIMYSDHFGVDLWILQRGQQKFMPSMLRQAKTHGIVTAYDIDDDLFNMPEVGHWKKMYGNEAILKNITDCINAVDYVICSTEPLKESLAERFPSKRFAVVQNSIDINSFINSHLWRTQKEPTETVVIGWMASMSHVNDIPIVEEAIDKVMSENPNVVLYLIGPKDEDTFPIVKSRHSNRKLFHGWVDINDLPKHMGAIDIGICPVIDDKFNTAKSDIKQLQYQALGIPVVANESVTYPNIRHGEDGYACKSSDEWYEVLTMLVRDKTIRERVGAAGNRYARTRDVERTCYDMASLYRKMTKGEV